MGEPKKIKKKFGYEYPDPTPVEIPVELRKPETMDEKMRRIVREQISFRAAENGQETYEEANDFDVDDGFEDDALFSPYELKDMLPEYNENMVTPDGSPVYGESEASGDPKKSPEAGSESPGREIKANGTEIDVDSAKTDSGVSEGTDQGNQK